MHHARHWRLGADQVIFFPNVHCHLQVLMLDFVHRLIQAIFMMPGYMARQQEELYKKMVKRADEICAGLPEMNDGDKYDDDLPSTSTACAAGNGNEIAATAQEEKETEIDLETVPKLDIAAPLEVKKVN